MGRQIKQSPRTQKVYAQGLDDEALNFSSYERTCWKCEELKEELSKLRSMLRAIEQVPSEFGIAGDFDMESWIKRSALEIIFNAPEYK